MTKRSLFILATLAILTGCGQESSIKNAIEAENLRAPRTIKLVVPLTEDTIASFDTPIKAVTPILRGVLTPIMNFGTLVGLGKTKVSMDQPIPELPLSHLKEVKVKRLFFYLEATQAEQKIADEREQKRISKKEKRAEAKELRKNKKFVPRALDAIGSFFSDAKDGVVAGTNTVIEGVKSFTGQNPELDFTFLNELALTLESKKVPEINNWMPVVKTDDVSGNEKKFLSGLFKKNYEEDAKSEKVVLVKYKGSKSKNYTRNDEFGQVFIIETDTPAETRKAIQNDPLLTSYYTRIHTLNKSLLIELVKDPVVEENFMYVFNQKLSEQVKDIKPCDEKVCKDFQVNDINLVPLVARGNSLTMDVLLDVKSVPPSFQLKGFVEVEITIIPLPLE